VLCRGRAAKRGGALLGLRVRDLYSHLGPKAQQESGQNKQKILRIKCIVEHLDSSYGLLLRCATSSAPHIASGNSISSQNAHYFTTNNGKRQFG
jgi:hypothetical protein